MLAGPSTSSPLHLFIAYGRIGNQTRQKKSIFPIRRHPIELGHHCTLPKSKVNHLEDRYQAKVAASIPFPVGSCWSLHGPPQTHSSMLLCKYFSTLPLGQIHHTRFPSAFPCPSQANRLQFSFAAAVEASSYPSLSIENSEAGLGSDMHIHWPISA